MIEERDADYYDLDDEERYGEIPMTCSAASLTQRGESTT